MNPYLWRDLIFNITYLLNAVIQSAAAWEVYYKVRQVYYRVRQLLQSAAEIITECGSYYKVLQLLHNAAVQQAAKAY